MPRRTGYTMTELMVVLTLTSTVMAIGLGLLHRMMREQQFAAQENQVHRVAQRLSNQLRQDVCRSTRVEVAASTDLGEQSFVLHQQDSTITYTWRASSLTRQATRENEATHHDQFDFPSRYELKLDDGAPSKRVGLTLLVSPRGRAGDGSSSDLAPAMRVEATIGRDLRFTETEHTP